MTVSYQLPQFASFESTSTRTCPCGPTCPELCQAASLYTPATQHPSVCVASSTSVALVVLLVLSRLDYGNATLARLPTNQLDRLQSVLNAAARLVFSARKHEHITPLLRYLHWLLVPQRVGYKLAMLVYRCLHGLAPSYLADDLQLVADLESRHATTSSSSSVALVVPPSRLCAVGDRAFQVSAARVWNGLYRHTSHSRRRYTYSNAIRIDIPFFSKFSLRRFAIDN